VKTTKEEVKKVKATIETRDDNTIVRFLKQEDFLLFHGNMIYTLGEKLYNDIRTQFVEKGEPYAFIFKTKDYDSLIDKFIDKIA
jgi:hypothetical protein